MSLPKDQLEDVFCPTCGKDEERKLIFSRADGISFYNCLKCNIDYASPRLKEK